MTGEAVAVGNRSYRGHRLQVCDVLVILNSIQDPVKKSVRRSRFRCKPSIIGRHADGLDHAVAGQDADFVELSSAPLDHARRDHLGIVLPRDPLGDLAQVVGKSCRCRQQQTQRKGQRRGAQGCGKAASG